MPALSVVVVTLATPEVRVAVAITADPLRKLTVPVGVPYPGGFAGDTFAARTTGEPNTAAVGAATSTETDGRAVTVSVQDPELEPKALVGR